MNRRYIPILPLLMLLASCSEQPAEQAVQVASTTQPPAEQSMAKADPHAGLNLNTQPSRATNQQVPSGNARPVMTGQGRGKAITVEQAGGYTYVEVDRGGQRIWLAGNRSEVKPGDHVKWNDGAVMRNFHSKALQRDFPALMFVSSVLKDSGVASATTGKVLTVSNAVGYCYLEVETGEGNIWLAAPEKAINVGDSVRWSGGSAMHDFHSKSLERDFETILFVSAVEVI